MINSVPVLKTYKYSILLSTFKSKVQDAASGKPYIPIYLPLDSILTIYKIELVKVEVYNGF
jgi:hypothetical protein